MNELYMLKNGTPSKSTFWIWKIIAVFRSRKPYNLLYYIISPALCFTDRSVYWLCLVLDLPVSGFQVPRGGSLGMSGLVIGGEEVPKVHSPTSGGWWSTLPLWLTVAGTYKLSGPCWGASGSSSSQFPLDRSQMKLGNPQREDLELNRFS